MNRVLLDTSAYIALTKNHAGIIEAVSNADVICITPIVLGELLAGFRKGTHYEQNEARLSAFLNQEDVQIFLLDQQTSERFAVIHEFLRKAGTPLSPNDLWIAASAMQYGVKVLTTDSDFQKIPQILLEFFE